MSFVCTVIRQLLMKSPLQFGIILNTGKITNQSALEMTATLQFKWTNLLLFNRRQEMGR